MGRAPFFEVFHERTYSRARNEKSTIVPDLVTSAWMSSWSEICENFSFPLFLLFVKKIYVTLWSPLPRSKSVPSPAKDQLHTKSMQCTGQ